MWGIPEERGGKEGHTHAVIAHVVVDVAPLLKTRGPRKTRWAHFKPSKFYFKSGQKNFWFFLILEV